MSRDYARRRPEKKRGTRPWVFRAWFWLVLGAVLLFLAILLGIYFAFPRLSALWQLSSHPPIEVAQPVALPPPPAPAPNITPLTIVFQAAPAEPPATHYYLSYGIYPAGDDLNLLTAALTAAQIPFQNHALRQEGSLVYRVESGPYPDLAAALAAQNQALAKKISAILRLAP